MKYICLLLFIPFAVSAKSQNDTLEAIRKSHNIPEIGCAVISSAGIQQMAVAGYHRIDRMGSADTARTNDVIHLGSNSKAITGFVAAQLVAKGLSLASRIICW